MDRAVKKAWSQQDKLIQSESKVNMYIKFTDEINKIRNEYYKKSEEYNKLTDKLLRVSNIVKKIKKELEEEGIKL